MASPYVTEILEHDFESAVILRSHDVPVLVDFWAPWCAPCKALGPALEAVAVEMDGAFELVKVNTDESPRLAEAAGIQSIPTVFLFKAGRPVDGFQGALSKADLKRFLEPHLGAAPTADVAVDAGDDDVKAGAEARLAENPDDAEAHLVLAKIALGEGDTEAATRHLDAIAEDAAEAAAAAPLRAALAFREACTGSEDELRAKVAADEGDLDAQYALGSCLAAEGRYEDALEVFLESVKRDKSHADEAARKAMVTIFGILGDEHEAAMEYRRQLAIWL